VLAAPTVRFPDLLRLVHAHLTDYPHLDLPPAADQYEGTDVHAPFLITLSSSYTGSVEAMEMANDTSSLSGFEAQLTTCADKRVSSALKRATRRHVQHQDDKGASLEAHAPEHSSTIILSESEVACSRSGATFADLHAVAAEESRTRTHRVFARCTGYA
jgi:hypothetical protein